MKDHWLRSLGAATAAGVLALGVWALLAGTAAGVGEQTYTIEVNDTGFNPVYCTVHRTDVVRWKNVGTKSHQVIVPDQSAALNQPPKFDSGPLAPGETSTGLSWGARSKVEYYEASSPNAKAVLDFGDGAPNCAPGLPTPTPTPTKTGLPATGIPPRCIGAMGCAVAPAIARDPD